MAFEFFSMGSEGSDEVKIKDVENVVIIGSGPAGLTAAIYAARAGLEPLLIEGVPAGGQLMDTTEVENFPGYPEGVQGPQLIDDIRKQAERFGTRFLSDQVTETNLASDPKIIKTDTGKEIKAHAVIISTGASARYLGLESEQRLKGFGVSACAVCDGFFFKDQTVAVIGGGDSALTDALYLTKHAAKIYVIHRRDKFRAAKVLQDRVFAHEKIEVIWDHVVTEVLGDEDSGVTGIRIKNVKTGEEKVLELQGMFVAIGHDPNTSVFKGQIELDSKGYIVVKHPSSETSQPGVFAAGDVMDPHYQQAVTAAASGCKAALDAQDYLGEKGILD